MSMDPEVYRDRRIAALLLANLTAMCAVELRLNGDFQPASSETFDKVVAQLARQRYEEAAKEISWGDPPSAFQDPADR